MTASPPSLLPLTRRARRPRGFTPRAGRGLLFAVLAVATVFIVGHGCHGDDEDHEPAVAPPISVSAGDPR